MCVSGPSRVQTDGEAAAFGVARRGPGLRARVLDRDLRPHDGRLRLRPLWLVVASQEAGDQDGGRDHEHAAEGGRDLEPLGERLSGGLEHVGGRHPGPRAGTATAPPSVSPAVAAASSGRLAGNALAARAR